MRTKDSKRWLQLVLGVCCMITIANLQYGWTLFVAPIDEKYHWGRPAIQLAFTIFILAETWLVPLEGYLIDRIGPRLMVACGGALVGLAWVINSQAGTLFLLYAGAAVGGTGAGIVYSAAIGNALKWFPDRRGLASGLTSAGFGIGSAITVIPIATMIDLSGYQLTFLYFGIVQGLIIILIAPLLRFPRLGETPLPSATKPAISVDHHPSQVLREPIFWLLYVMFALVVAGGLMSTAQLALMALDFKIAETPVSFLGLTLPALTFAMTLDRTLNGITRPFFGWVSDKLGRENTMFMAFLLEAAAICLLIAFGNHPTLFVVFSAMVFFAWGEIFTLFPSTCTDIFGSKFATTNFGLLYTAKGVAAILVPLGSVLTIATGTWTPIFIMAAFFNTLAAGLALLVLKPMRRRLNASSTAVGEVRTA